MYSVSSDLSNLSDSNKHTSTIKRSIPVFSRLAFNDTVSQLGKMTRNDRTVSSRKNGSCSNELTVTDRLLREGVISPWRYAAH